MLAQSRKQHVEEDVLAVGVDPPFFQPAGVEQLVDQAVEPVEVVDHAAVEVAALFLADLAAGERLQIELHRGDRRLQLVGHAVDEVRLPPVEIDRLDREHQVDDRAGQEHADEGRADRQQGPIDPRHLDCPSTGPNTVSSTQPTVSTTRITIITIARTIGKLSERRAAMVGQRENASGKTGADRAVPQCGA